MDRSLINHTGDEVMRNMLIMVKYCALRRITLPCTSMELAKELPETTVPTLEPSTKSNPGILDTNIISISQRPPWLIQLYSAGGPGQIEIMIHIGSLWMLILNHVLKTRTWYRLHCDMFLNWNIVWLISLQSLRSLPSTHWITCHWTPPWVRYAQLRLLMDQWMHIGSFIRVNPHCP